MRKSCCYVPARHSAMIPEHGTDPTNDLEAGIALLRRSPRDRRSLRRLRPFPAYVSTAYACLNNEEAARTSSRFLYSSGQCSFTIPRAKTMTWA